MNGIAAPSFGRSRSGILRSAVVLVVFAFLTRFRRTLQRSVSQALPYAPQQTVPLRKALCRSGRVSRARHRSQSLQMATLPRRHYHVVCALVSALPHFCGPDG
jgi:hypothetical protein